MREVKLILNIGLSNISGSKISISIEVDPAIWKYDDKNTRQADDSFSRKFKLLKEKKQKKAKKKIIGNKLSESKMNSIVNVINEVRK